MDFAQQCVAVGLPEPVAEFRFAPPRRWRIDWCWPEKQLAVEVEGGAWTGGRHTRGGGFHRDLEKYNTLALMGWRLLRVTPRMVRTGEALMWVVQFFDKKEIS